MTRKYSVAEIDEMRQSISWFFGSGCYNPVERAAAIENRLRTYMQNGTEPDELKSAAGGVARARQEAVLQLQAVREVAPRPRKLVTKEDVIDEWFETSVAHYDGASVEARELFDGFGGITLTSFANRHAPDGVNIKQRDMEAYLERRGVKSRSAMFAKRYDGIRHIIHGNVRSGNYGT